MSYCVKKGERSIIFPLRLSENLGRRQRMSKPHGKADHLLWLADKLYAYASSWPFRQAANLLRQLTGVELSFSHILGLCANQAEIVSARDPAESDKVEWEAPAETTEVLVESAANQPRQPMAPSTHHSSI